MSISRIAGGRPGDEIFRPCLVERIEILLHKKVRHTCGKLQANGCSNRATALVWRDHTAVGQCEISHGQAIGDATKAHLVRLKDVDSTPGSHGKELAYGIIHFARRNAYRTACGYRV